MSAHALLRLSFAGDAETDTRVDVTSRTGGYASGVIISFDICMLADGESCRNDDCPVFDWMGRTRGEPYTTTVPACAMYCTPSAQAGLSAPVIASQRATSHT
jgi:hypothetical protein